MMSCHCGSELIKVWRNDKFKYFFPELYEDIFSSFEHTVHSGLDIAKMALKIPYG